MDGVDTLQPPVKPPPSESPEARRKRLIDVLEREGCSVVYPPEVAIPQNLDLTGFPEGDQQGIKIALEGIASFINKPMVIDRFDTDN